MANVRFYTSHISRASDLKPIVIRLVSIEKVYYAVKADLIDVALANGGVNISISAAELEKFLGGAKGSAPISFVHLLPLVKGKFIDRNSVLLEERHWHRFLKLFQMGSGMNDGIAGQIIERRVAIPVQPDGQPTKADLEHQVYRLTRRVKNLEKALLRFLKGEPSDLSAINEQVQSDNVN